ncbi:hypothetical protein CV102_01870 [Natronococcus pandeyae]|uniref:DUF7344 domain-containing protein n=1 Tax=Natronococcus pandeyae TaxID=2055836 RepID=A0A8J8Q7W9_9EURY|nr:hypothetical protein [Natronococcus pandeyae]TYL40348.1 hypothetical protein CV102_01870 [Natronococcus pandeyae]
MTPKIDRSAHSSDEPAPEAASEEMPTLSSDEIFHILQTNRRRDTIRYLLEEDGPVKMRDVAEYVAARENETTVAKLSSTERQRVYIPLYQSHLPKLDEEGVIEYNQPRGIVRPTEQLDTFEPYIKATEDGASSLESQASSGPTVKEYYATAVAASASLLLASVAGVLTIPGLVLGAIITALFALITLVTNLPQFVESANSLSLQ